MRNELVINTLEDDVLEERIKHFKWKSLFALTLVIGFCIVLLTIFYQPNIRPPQPWDLIVNAILTSIIVSATAGIFFEVLIRREFWTLHKRVQQKHEKLLRKLGYVTSYENISQAIDATSKIDYKKVESLRILAISGYECFSRNEFFKWLRDISSTSSKISVLLLNPDSKYLRYRAIECWPTWSETEHKETIKTNVTKLERTKKEFGRDNSNFKIQFYERHPVWRLVFVNDFVYVNPYPRDATTAITKTHVFRKTLADKYQSLYETFEKHFLDLSGELEQDLKTRRVPSPHSTS